MGGIADFRVGCVLKIANGVQTRWRAIRYFGGEIFIAEFPPLKLLNIGLEVLLGGKIENVLFDEVMGNFIKQ